VVDRSLLHRLLARLPAGLRRALKSVPGASRLRDRVYGLPHGKTPPEGSLRPIVYLPTWLRWDAMKQRPQYLLEAFARAGHEVWFVDPRVAQEEHREPGIRLVGSLGPTPRSDVILYTHFAPTRTLVELYENPAVVYDILDDLSIYDPAEKGVPDSLRVRSHHGPLAGDADVVITSSAVLEEKHHAERNDILLVENGVDLELFSPGAASQPADSPVVGYHGAIAPWFDFALVDQLARARPAYEIRLVGPVRPEVSEAMERLLTLANVIHVGEQPTGSIVESVRSFDVGLIPFLVDEMTAGVSPLKLYEYLACLVPVVSTPLPASVDHPAVSVATNPGEFAALVDIALEMGPEERAALRGHAETASWDQRIAPLLERLDSLGLRLVSS